MLGQIKKALNISKIMVVGAVPSTDSVKQSVNCIELELQTK